MSHVGINIPKNKKYKRQRYTSFVMSEKSVFMLSRIDVFRLFKIKIIILISKKSNVNIAKFIIKSDMFKNFNEIDGTNFGYS